MRRLLFCMAAAAAVMVPMAGSSSWAGERPAPVVSAESAKPTLGPGLPVWLGGKELEFNPPSATVNGTLFVPVTRLAHAFEVKEEYLGDSVAPTLLKASNGETTLTFHAGSATMERNGRDAALPSAPYVDDEFLYVPLRKFAESFGYIVRWDELKHAVVMEKEWDALPAVGSAEKLRELLGASGNGGVRLMDKSGLTVTDQAAAAPAAAPSAGAAGEAPVSKSDKADYSGTNVQVAGVDEGDLVKTDGTYLYQVSGGKIVITRAVPGADMKVEARMPLDERFTPSELYLDGDRLVVIGRSSLATVQPKPVPGFHAEPAAPAAQPAVRAEPTAPAAPEAQAAPASAAVASKMRILPYRMSSTKAVVYDVADRDNPKRLRTVELDGNAVATRKVGSVLYFVANSPAYSYLKDKDDAASGPSYRDSALGEESKPIGLSDIRYFPGSIRPYYMLVGGLDLDRPERPFAVSAFLGAGQEVYMSQKSLYVATMQYNAVPLPQPMQPAQPAADSPAIAVRKPEAYEPSTTVYRFTLDEGRVRYAAKGDVPGTALNQFSMDEYDDTFRIATTKPDGNALYTLDQSMQTIGRLEQLAPGERIYSARFLGGRAYLVTFKQVDPLFVIDVADPKRPTVLGALKIPGYSDYLHPYDETHLIGFGKETTQEGKGGAVLTQGMKVSLFDVSDVAHPIEMFKTTIGDRGTESELLHDYKALLFSREKDLLAFPVAVRETAKQPDAQSPFAYGTLTFQGAYVYKLDLSTGFRLQGRITHLNEQNSLKTGYDAYNPTYAVKRVLYVGDTLYTVSDGAVQANEIGTLQEQGRVELGE